MSFISYRGRMGQVTLCLIGLAVFIVKVFLPAELTQTQQFVFTFYIATPLCIPPAVYSLYRRINSKTPLDSAFYIPLPLLPFLLAGIGYYYEHYDRIVPAVTPSLP